MALFGCTIIATILTALNKMNRMYYWNMLYPLYVIINISYILLYIYIFDAYKMQKEIRKIYQIYCVSEKGKEIPSILFKIARIVIALVYIFCFNFNSLMMEVPVHRNQSIDLLCIKELKSLKELKEASRRVIHDGAFLRE